MVVPQGVNKLSQRSSFKKVDRVFALNALLRHPLTLPVVGFLLTAGIGGVIQTVSIDLIAHQP